MSTVRAAWYHTQLGRGSPALEFGLVIASQRGRPIQERRQIGGRREQLKTMVVNYLKLFGAADRGSSFKLMPVRN